MILVRTERGQVLRRVRTLCWGIMLALESTVV